MQNNSVKDVVFKELSPLVDSLGYELVEVEYTKKPNGMNLTLFIDSPHGVDMDGLEKVHRAVDEKLDEFDPTNGAHYILNCSSLGLDRPIKTDKDLNRNIGQKIEISLYSKYDNKKDYIGILESYSDEQIIICDSVKSIEIPRELISKIKKYIEF